jgi:hypothetical protein
MFWRPHEAAAALAAALAVPAAALCPSSEDPASAAQRLRTSPEPALTAALLELQECLALAAGDEEPCALLAGLWDPWMSPLDGRCREDVLRARFLKEALAAPGGPAPACLRLVSDGGYFTGDGAADACRRLGRALRAQYSPVCFELAWGGQLNPGRDPSDFFMLCETYLYPSSENACRLRRDPAGRASCRLGAAQRGALVSGDPAACEGRSLCLELAGRGDGCRSARAALERAYCSDRGEER